MIHRSGWCYVYKERSVHDRTPQGPLWSCPGHHRDIKGLEACAVDLLLSSKVYDKTRRHEIEPRYHLTKGKADYLMVGPMGLHRIVALAWLRVSGQLDLYRKAIASPSAYPCHHIKPWTKLDQRGNNIFNVEILPRTIHQRYESIATQLAAKYKRGELVIDDETNLKMVAE